MALWTIDHQFDQPIRHVNQAASGGSYVAIFTPRLAPDLNDAAVRFASAIDEPEAEPWIPCIEEGVRAFVDRRAREGFPMGHLRVTLVAITLHPVDSNPRRLRQAAEMAMSQAFEATGVDLDA
jgi:translation elongation factor EF-G